MAIKITKGKIARAQRVVAYGVEGVGKSTLAAAVESVIGAKVLFVDVEAGSAHLDVDRAEPSNMAEVRQVLRDLIKSPEYGAVVIDTIDWMEQQIVDEMLKADDKKSLSDYQWGDGFTKQAERMMELLEILNIVRDAGKHVILLGHSTVKSHTAPDAANAYDRYEMKLSKKGGPLVKEWADAILFLNYDTKTVTDANKRTRAIGGSNRIILTERTAAFDAKNRHGLPPKISFETPEDAVKALVSVFTPYKQPESKAPVGAIVNTVAMSPLENFLDLIKGREEDARSYLIANDRLSAEDHFDALSADFIAAALKTPLRFLAALDAAKYPQTTNP